MDTGRAMAPPRPALPVGLLGQADCAGLGGAFEPRGDIDSVAHEVAVALLDDVADISDSRPRWLTPPATPISCA
jgi:hypothetical protein